MLEKVSAVYPNTYRGMDERQRARVIDEWHKALEKYPVQICQRAWEKYKIMMRVKELNIALFVGVIKDLLEADRRDQKRLELAQSDEVEHNAEWQDARRICMEKCSKAFGRKF